MEAALAGVFQQINETVRQSGLSLRVSQEGRVLSVGDGIARIAGLRDAKLYELIQLEGCDQGIVLDISADSIGIVLLTPCLDVRAGMRASKTERLASIGVGEGLLGRVVDPMGNPLDGGPVPESAATYPVERTAPPLIQRDFVNAPLYTGITAIDSMLAIGRGQRELILGDPSTGKTAIAVDTIINQKDTGVICVYAAIGQKNSRILKTIEEIKKYGEFSHAVCVAASASDSVGIQYIAPYSATAIAEYFLDRGRDVLIVYDDLTKHAEAYRSLSLLLRRPPGREAYPGDIFFLHARLLERSAKLDRSYGGGSITALPIVETQQGRISAYIPTNLISITDGQIYLDTSLFNKGLRPAVDVARSVSRIGGKAQSEAMKKVAAGFKIDYSRFMEVEVFTKFGARVEEETAKLIRRGERMRELLKQPPLHPLPVEDQIMRMTILGTGALDGIELAAVDKTCREMLDLVKSEMPEAMQRLRNGATLTEKDTARLGGLIARPGG